MATKKTKSKAPSQGVVGLLKKIVKGKSTAATARPTPKIKRAKAAKAKPAAKTKPAAKAKAPSVKETRAVSGKQAKAAVPVSAPVPANGKDAVPVPPVKKKPPSITITRPEVTRPPVVLPPPRPLEAPIGAPSILVPKDGAATTSLTPMLRWMYVGGATQYEVEWSADANFGRGRSSLVAQQTAITLDPSHQLKPSTNYKWRVRGGNDAGWGPWSHPESFRSPEK